MPALYNASGLIFFIMLISLIFKQAVFTITLVLPHKREGTR